VCAFCSVVVPIVGSIWQAVDVDGAADARDDAVELARVVECGACRRVVASQSQWRTRVDAIVSCL
jgi:hypothetical protein